MRRHRLASLALGLAAAACNEHSLVALGDTLHGASTQPPQRLASNAVDILWLVDSSGSMQDEQAELAQRFDGFIDSLSELQADFRLAVVTTDFGRTEGRFAVGPGTFKQMNCTDTLPELQYCDDVSFPQPFIEVRNYLENPDDLSSGFRDDPETEAIEGKEDLKAHFGCIARAGDCGTGLEAGLQALRGALAPEVLAGPNGNFIREDAFLVVIILSDEDDCSTNGSFVPAEDYQCYASEYRDQLLPIQRVFDDIVAAKGEPESILVAGLIGPDDNQEPLPLAQIRARGGVPDSCNAQIGFECSSETDACEGGTGPDGALCGANWFCERGTVQAKDGERYRDLIELFGGRGVNESLCQADFSSALTNISRILSQTLSVNCVAPNPAPATCESDADCGAGALCMQPRVGNLSGGARYCSNFELTIEVSPPEGGAWTTLTSPGPVEDAENQQSAPGAQFTVDYDAVQCASGLAFRFAAGARPRPNSLYRITYPMATEVITAQDPGTVAP